MHSTNAYKRGKTVTLFFTRQHCWLQVVQSLGFDVKQEFPIYADRMPAQLLAYLRLSRVQDSAEIAKVCGDVMLKTFNSNRETTC